MKPNQFRNVKYNLLFVFMAIGKTLTFFSSFTISSPNCVLNFEPTEINVNFPFDDILPLETNNIFRRGFDDSCTNASRDACKASLFFSINWLCKGKLFINCTDLLRLQADVLH